MEVVFIVSSSIIAQVLQRCGQLSCDGRFPDAHETFTVSSLINVKEQQQSAGFFNNWCEFWRDFFGKSPELLQRLTECSEENPAMVDLLVALFYLPARHLQEYSRLLLKLATCFEVVGEVLPRVLVLFAILPLMPPPQKKKSRHGCQNAQFQGIFGFKTIRISF